MHQTKSTISPFFLKLSYSYLLSFHNFSNTDVYRDNHTKQEMETVRGNT